MTDNKPKRPKRNPSAPLKGKKLSTLKGKPTKNLPKKATKELSLSAAKRIWFAPKTKGRPSKSAMIRIIEAKKILLAAKEPLKRQIVKKSVSRGRPRKHPKAATDKPKRPRGRPRKHPKAATDKPKRPRGRPKKADDKTKPRKRAECNKKPKDLDEKD